MREPKYYIQTERGKLELSKGNYIALKNRKCKAQKNSNLRFLSRSVKSSLTRNSSPQNKSLKISVKSNNRSCYITPKKIKTKDAFRKNLSEVYDDSFVFRNSKSLFKNIRQKIKDECQKNIQFGMQQKNNSEYFIQNNFQYLKRTKKPSICEFDCHYDQMQFKNIEEISLTKDQISIQQLKQFKKQINLQNKQKFELNHWNRDYQQNPEHINWANFNNIQEDETSWNNLSIDIALTTMYYK